MKQLKVLLLLFLALTFSDLPTCQSWLAEFEQRWNRSDPAWHYSKPMLLRNGGYCIEIIGSAIPKLTEAEKTQMVDLSEADLPDPPPMP